MCLEIQGPFAFSQVGIRQAFIKPLVENGVPIFTISTFDTDYILIQETFSGVSLNALQNAGHEIVPRDES